MPISGFAGCELKKGSMRRFDWLKCEAGSGRQRVLDHLKRKVGKFICYGGKLVVITSGDGGIETYDLKTWEKWTFARTRIDRPFEE